MTTSPVTESTRSPVSLRTRPLDDAQEVEQRQGLHTGLTDGVHAVGGDVAGGQSPIQSTILVDHGDGGDALLPA